MNAYLQTCRLCKVEKDIEMSANLQLLGCTAVEDKVCSVMFPRHFAHSFIPSSSFLVRQLQEGVAGTLQALFYSGIKLYMLTGLCFAAHPPSPPLLLKIHFIASPINSTQYNTMPNRINSTQHAHTTGDSLVTAKSVAISCGMLDADMGTSDRLVILDDSKDTPDAVLNALTDAKKKACIELFC